MLQIPGQRHGNAAVCAMCGEPLTPKRGSRRQMFCSARCRDAARRARNSAASGYSRPKTRNARRCVKKRCPLPRSPVPRSVKNPPVNSIACKTDFRGRGCVDEALWQRIVAAEVIGPHHWTTTVSSDGVVSEIAQLRPRALREPVHKANGGALDTIAESAPCARCSPQP
jgi:hypothetical protein